MTLPKGPPKRTETIAIRASKDTAAKLEALANSHGLSRGDVIESLVDQEYRKDRKVKSRPTQSKRSSR